ncbi:MAG TPA: CarD family transcriptional regulator, partial [Burkholderiales bacterium]|nr:CarD family transcriptional regulator [Burkholderiales bacterium]
MLQLPVPGSGHREYTAPLHGSSDALAIATLAARARPLLIVTDNAWQAQRLLDEIPYFDPKLKVHLFPDWETLPYDHFSPHSDLVSERLATLHQMMHDQFDISIVAVTTALYRLPPVAYLAGHTFFFKQGDKLDGAELRRQLTIAGYAHVTQVVAPGEYSFRGGLIDLFPMGSALPYRIDLFDDEIESIRSFDVDTQRSIYKVNEVRLLPAREFPMDEAAQKRFRHNFREKFEGDPSRSRVYKDVSKGIPTAGIEYYMPLFFESTALITDYVPEGTTVCVYPGLARSIEAFWTDTNSRHALLRGDLANPVLSPKDLFLSADQLFGALKRFPRLELTGIAANDNGARPAAPGPQDTSEAATAPLPPVAVERRADDPLHRVKSFVQSFDGRTLLLAESAGRRETMQEYFAEYGLKAAPAASYAEFAAAPDKVMLGVGPLHNGFVLTGDRLALLTENELYATQVRQRTQREVRRATNEYMLRDLSEVKVGDPVVHEQHGIGRYIGLQSMDLGEGETEFLTLEYAEGAKLYVPVSGLDLISRYSGAAPEQAPLHTLGSGQWDKAKRKAAKQVRDTAAELLDIYAQRASRVGHAFQLKQHDYEAF